MSAWSRRGFLAGAGTLATAGGAGTAASANADKRDVPLLRTYVTGANPRVVHKIARNLTPGAKLRLTREPENDYDARAVAVWTQEGAKLGYVPRIDNQAVANLMDAGLAPRALVERVRVGGSRPDVRIEVRLPIA